METLSGIFKELIKESSGGLSRVLSHIKADYPSAMISAFEPNRSAEDNERQTRKLEQELRRNRLGFIWTLGKYKYEDGTVADEISMFVPGKGKEDSEFSDLMLKVAKKFGQESIIFTPSHSEEVWFHYASGRQEKLGNKFSANQISDYMSRLLKKPNRSFVFESKYSFGESRNYLERWAYKVAQERNS